MSATLLRRLDMSESTRRLFHATAKSLHGQLEADFMFGKVTQSPVETSRRVYLPITSADCDKSRANCTCAKCSCRLTQDEIQSNSFEFEGATAFYLCDDCHRDAFLTGSSKPPRTSLKADED
jgi:hypothetical protein